MAEGIRLGQADPLDRWAIGDLCVEAVPPGIGKAERAADQRRLAEFAFATNLGMGLLKDCYRTSKAWPLGTRITGVTHAKHSTVASRPNRVNLLLNDDMADGLSMRMRDKVEKIEELLVDPEARAAVIDRSRTRSRRIKEAAKAIEDEELVKARTTQRLREQDAKARLAAPGILAKMDERAIKANVELAKMVTALLDLKSVIDQLPHQYHDRAAEYLCQIQRAAQQALDELRPATRSPQPRNVIDLNVDHQSGAEHR